jgi:integrase
MVLLQWHTGMRPGEVCSIRADEIDRTGTVWLYKPSYHKLAYRGKPRVIAIGKAGQEILAPFLDRPDFLLSPAHAVELWQAEKRANRKTPVQPSQQCRKKARPKRQPGEQYETMQYNRAIARACKAAGVEAWHPNQLRHSFATRVRAAFGLEAAQVVLGHSNAAITQVYAERDQTLAVKVASEIG